MPLSIYCIYDIGPQALWHARCHFFGLLFAAKIRKRTSPSQAQERAAARSTRASRMAGAAVDAVRQCLAGST